ncbi:MAG: diguanylate cyclase [Pseudomonas sp.]|nr:diguanylate cyclase [Pseudomonas sp.]
MPLPSLEWVNQDSAYLRQLRAGFAWLRFTPQLEVEFRRYHVEAYLLRMRGAVLVSCVMWLLFSLLDYASMPGEFRLQSLALRMLLFPLLLGTWWATFRPQWRDRLQLLAGICALTAGLSIAGVIWIARVHGFALPYEGIILMTVFFYFLIGLRFRTAVVCGWLTFCAYLAVELYTGLAAKVLVYNAFFLGTANLIGSFGCYFLEHSARETFIAQGLLEDIAERDFLTGLLNRRAFSEQASRSWRQAVRAQQPVAVLMLDVDFFKAYNDHYGHAAGDLALQAVARALGAHAQRPLDVLARYGGEEFVGLWVDVSQEAILTLAEGIRADVQALALSHQHSAVADVVTLSIGIAYLLAPQPGALEEAQRLADGALYQAKEQGRNRVELRALTR